MRPGPGAEHGGNARARLLGLTAALVAGLSAWLIDEQVVVRPFAPPAHLVGRMGVGTELIKRKFASEIRDATIALTVQGAALGLALGIAGAISRARDAGGGSAASGLVAAAVGAAAGAGAGYGASRALLPLFQRFLIEIADSLIIPLLLHGGLWGAVGAAGGLAYGLGLRRPGVLGLLRPVLGGLAGSLLGMIAFQLAGALALPAAGTTLPMPTTRVARLLAALALSLSVSAGAVESLRNPRKQSPGEPLQTRLAAGDGCP